MQIYLDAHALTLYWLEKIIIDLELCPFAKAPYLNGLVRIAECTQKSIVGQTNYFLNELEFLQQNLPTTLSTTLLFFSNSNKSFKSFLDFNDFVGSCEELLISVGLEEHFQIVLFHPKFIFEKTHIDDPTNWVGRSPYPTIHILRNAEIEQALKHSSDAVHLSEKNKLKLEALSTEELKRLFYYL